MACKSRKNNGTISRQTVLASWVGRVATLEEWEEFSGLDIWKAKAGAGTTEGATRKPEELELEFEYERFRHKRYVSAGIRFTSKQWSTHRKTGVGIFEKHRVNKKRRPLCNLIKLQRNDCVLIAKKSLWASQKQSRFSCVSLRSAYTEMRHRRQVRRGSIHFVFESHRVIRHLLNLNLLAGIFAPCLSEQHWRALMGEPRFPPFISRWKNNQSESNRSCHHLSLVFKPVTSMVFVMVPRGNSRWL